MHAAAVVFSKHSFEPLLFSIFVSFFESIVFVSLTQLTPEGLDEMIHPRIYVTVIAYAGLLGQPHKVDDHLLNLALSCSNLSLTLSFSLTNTCSCPFLFTCQPSYSLLSKICSHHLVPLPSFSSSSSIQPVEVLVQGMIVDQSNVGDITSSLVQQIHRLENKLAQGMCVLLINILGYM